MEELLRYLLLVLLTYLGLAAGTVISNYSKEELKPGRRYFLPLLSILLGLAALFYLVEISVPFWIALITSLITGYVSSLFRGFHNLPSYVLFAIMVYESLGSHYSPIICTLIFLYGTTYASLRAEDLEDNDFFQRLVAVHLENIIYPFAAMVAFLIHP
ncbi:MAG: hypothetical protein HGA85_08860 [Nanoarchaeota archaeon]|nr:hypothetical protein [Nanoarchaeota archaeon]